MMYFLSDNLENAYIFWVWIKCPPVCFFVCVWTCKQVMRRCILEMILESEKNYLEALKRILEVFIILFMFWYTLQCKLVF